MFLIKLILSKKIYAFNEIEINLHRQKPQQHISGEQEMCNLVT